MNRKSDQAKVELFKSSKLKKSEGIRLNKLLNSLGLGSRRYCDELIAQGRIQVEQAVAELGQKVLFGSKIFLDGKPLPNFQNQLRVILYHKPTGEISSRSDPENRPSIFNRIPEVKDDKSFKAIGRLDFNTSGLVIFTNSGALANYYMHPSYEHEREYYLNFFGKPLSSAEENQLKSGIMLEDGPAQVSALQLLQINRSNCLYAVVVKEGRNRLLRRLFESLNRPVRKLIRVRFGSFTLPPSLRPGEFLEYESVQLKRILGDDYYRYSSWGEQS